VFFYFFYKLYTTKIDCNRKNAAKKKQTIVGVRTRKKKKKKKNHSFNYSKSVHMYNIPVEKLLYTNVLSKRGWPELTQCTDRLPEKLDPLTKKCITVFKTQDVLCSDQDVLIYTVPESVGKNLVETIITDAIRVGVRYIIVLAPKFSIHVTNMFMECDFPRHELFQHSFVILDRTANRLTCRYRVLTEQQVVAVEDRMKIDRIKLPIMKVSDVAVKIYGFQPGQVVQILHSDEFRYVE
jgi:DNA-directed RNA polymerase subunit H (RpoH/RPB5)